MRDGRPPAWLLSFALIVALGFAGYGFILQPDQVLYSPHSDILAYHLGAKEVLWRSVEAGRGIPFWRADQLAGGPAFTGPNALYTYPLHFLFYLYPPAAAVGWTVFLHLVVGAGAFYALGVSLRLGNLACLFMAVSALFNFKVLMIVYAGWLSVLPSLTLLPLLFAAVFRMKADPRPKATLFAAAVGALCLHAGQLQLVYYAGWFLLAFVVVAVFERWRAGDGQEARRMAGRICFAGLLAAGLAAYLLLPIVAEIPLVTRSVASEEFFRSGRVVQLRHLLTFLYPEALGTVLDGSYPGVEMWESVAYFGIVPLCLGMGGVVAGWNRAMTGFLFGSFGASVAFALDTPLLRLPYALLPGFSLFRLPGRLLFLSALFGIALAGIGVEVLAARLRARGWDGWKPVALAGALLVAMAAEGMLYARGYLDTIDRASAVPVTEYASFLQADRDLFRIMPVGRNTVSYGWAAPTGLQLVSGYEPYNLRHYQRYVSLMSTGTDPREDAVVWTDVTRIARWDLADALNVKYLLAPIPLQLPAHRFDLVAEFHRQPVFVFYTGMQWANVFVYRNRNVIPRATWAERVAHTGEDHETIAVIQGGDLRGTGVVQGANEKEAEKSTPRRSPDDRVMVLDSADGRLVVETENLAERLLVISEVWHPGWTATLDGRDLPLIRANLALLGAWIPPGRHRLVLQFRPLHWRIGLAVSALSVATFLLCLPRFRRFPRRRRGAGRDLA
ncbi:MAG: hypothetical protein EHM71_00635 [Zetaproteobacteria bacterium]|nr:MAG: hypothetical protein EHM71_00635 [Zetaproteobacteria bacterium]